MEIDKHLKKEWKELKRVGEDDRTYCKDTKTAKS